MIAHFSGEYLVKERKSNTCIALLWALQDMQSLKQVKGFRPSVCLCFCEIINDAGSQKLLN